MAGSGKPHKKGGKMEKLMVKDLMVDLEKGSRVWEVMNKPEEKSSELPIRLVSGNELRILQMQQQMQQMQQQIPRNFFSAGQLTNITF